MNTQQFNKTFGIGDKVTYTDDFGDKSETTLRSIAWDCCGSGLVKIQSRSGGVDIERIQKVV